MADSVEMQDIRGLDIDTTLKGFAEEEFIFYNMVTVASMSGDQVRWYQETAGDLTATSPSKITNVAPLAQPERLQKTWTRNVSYYEKFFVEDEISEEDSTSSDIDVKARTLRALTRAIAKQIDSHIWDIMTESQSASNINSVTSTAAWDAASGQDPIEDLLEALQDIEENSYSTDGAVIFLSPKDKKSLINWLISDNGSNVPGFSSRLAENGTMMTILGKRVVVSNNVTADYAVVAVPDRAVTYKEHTPLRAIQINDDGRAVKLRIVARGVAILTDPKCVSLISNTQA